jgi:hypothetical protein
VGEGEGKGGSQVYEVYEVKKGGGKLRCLLLRRKTEKYDVYICEVFTSPEKEKRSTLHYYYGQPGRDTRVELVNRLGT